jgi:hypothetical protein
LQKRVVCEVFARRAIAGQDRPERDEPLNLGRIHVIERSAFTAHHLACRIGRHRFPHSSQGERRNVAHHDLYMPPGASTP